MIDIRVKEVVYYVPTDEEAGKREWMIEVNGAVHWMSPRGVPWHEAYKAAPVKECVAVKVLMFYYDGAA